MALRLITAGESHGPGLTCIVEGLPAGLQLRPEDLNADMARRQLGHGRGGRMKIERDAAEVTAGVRHGRTLGGPIALQVANRDYANWEERMSPWPVGGRSVAEVHLPRPGHADLVGTQKYKQTDVRNILERASARETAARVAGGALCKAFLRALGVEVYSHVIQIASVHAPLWERALAPEDFAAVDSSPVRCLDAEATQGDGARDRRAAQGERVARRRVRGAGVRVASRARLAHLLGGAPRRAPGDGDLLDPGDQGRRDRRRLRGRGRAGLAGPRRDLLLRDPRLLPRDQPLRRAGGGMTTGEPLIVRGAMKPLPTLTKPLRSVDTATHEPAQALRERTDSCTVPAAGVVGEAMVALVLADAYRQKFGGDHIDDVLQAVRAYEERIGWRSS